MAAEVVSEALMPSFSQAHQLHTRRALFHYERIGAANRAIEAGPNHHSIGAFARGARKSFTVEDVMSPSLTAVVRMLAESDLYRVR